MSKRQFELWFAVGRPNEPRSNIWIILGPKGKKSDIYITHLQMSGSMKTSLHDGGVWQVSFNREFVNKQEEKGNWRRNSRHLERWNPTSNIATGVDIAFRILIPTSELRLSGVPIPNKKSVKWIEPALQNKAIEIAVLMTNPGVRITSWGKVGTENVSIFFDQSLPNNGALYVVYYNNPLGEWFKNELSYVRTRLLDTPGQVFNEEIDISKIKTRLIVGKIEQDGSQTMMDLAGDTILTDEILNNLK